MRILLLPNTLQQAFDGIDEMQDVGMLSRCAAFLLKSLYARGWEDGVALLQNEELTRDTGMSNTSVDLALYELLSEGLARWRSGAQDVLELPALANTDGNRWPTLSWWRYRIIAE
jgi:DNA-binding transcriptional MocR family regulator